VTDTPRAASALRIVLNAMSGAGNRLGAMVIGFSLTPFIINTLGISRYGLWAVVGSLAGYLGLLDFGLGGAFVRFIAGYVERGDRAGARQVISFGLIFYAILGLAFALPIFAFAPLIVHAFKMPPDQYASAAALLRAMFAVLVVTLLAGVPGMVIVSMQRMDLVSRNAFIAYLAYAAATVVFLKLGFGLTGIVLGSAAQALVGGVLQYRTARRLFGPIWHDSLRFERAVVGRLFAFGGWTQVTAIFGILNLDVGRFIAAGIVSVASVGYYEIGSKLAFFARSIPMYLLNALMPAAASADARRDERALRRMYASGTRYQMFLTLALVGFIAGGIDPMVRVWLGRPYPFVAEIVFWLTIGYGVSGLNGVGATILRAMGHPRYEAQYVVVGTVANLAGTVFLARAYGIVGVAMATAVGWLVGTIYFTAVFHRVRRTPWWLEIGWPSLRLALACALAGSAYAYVLHVPAIFALFAHRPVGCLVLGAISLAYFAAFGALTWLFGVWHDDRPQLTARWNELSTKVSTRFAAGLPGRGTPS
jgi:O-antigen/teichoic acid export membrane protein